MRQLKEQEASLADREVLKREGSFGHLFNCNSEHLRSFKNEFLETAVLSLYSQLGYCKNNSKAMFCHGLAKGSRLFSLRLMELRNG